jgi:carbonic anhydrase
MRTAETASSDLASRPRRLLSFLLGVLTVLTASPLMAADDHDFVNPNSIESALKALKEGNARFVASQPTHPNQSKERLKDLADHGQAPMAAVLACSDSRVPIEELFDMGFGDLFVIRAAGAVPGVDQVGSLEYAVAHLKVPVILVLSHTSCGALGAAISGAKEPGALGQLIKKLDPVAIAVSGLDEAKRLQTAVELSAAIFREQLPLVSPVLDEAVKSGKLLIVSGFYDIATGKVTIDEPAPPKAAADEAANAEAAPAETAAASDASPAETAPPAPEPADAPGTEGDGAPVPDGQEP